MPIVSANEPDHDRRDGLRIVIGGSATRRGETPTTTPIQRDALAMPRGSRLTRVTPPVRRSAGACAAPARR